MQEAVKRVNISITEDTHERLKQYAWEHKTSVSHAITELIWKAKVSNEQLRGQTNIESMIEKPKKRATKK